VRGLSELFAAVASPRSRSARAGGSDAPVRSRDAPPVKQATATARRGDATARVGDARGDLSTGGVRGRQDRHARTSEEGRQRHVRYRALLFSQSASRTGGSSETRRSPRRRRKGPQPRSSELRTAALRIVRGIATSERGADRSARPARYSRDNLLSSAAATRGGHRLRRVAPSGARNRTTPAIPSRATRRGTATVAMRRSSRTRRTPETRVAGPRAGRRRDGGGGDAAQDAEG